MKKHFFGRHLSVDPNFVSVASDFGERLRVAPVVVDVVGHEDIDFGGLLRVVPDVVDIAGDVGEHLRVVFVVGKGSCGSTRSTASRPAEPCRRERAGRQVHDGKRRRTRATSCRRRLRWRGQCR